MLPNLLHNSLRLKRHPLYRRLKEYVKKMWIRLIINLFKSERSILLQFDYKTNNKQLGDIMSNSDQKTNIVNIHNKTKTVLTLSTDTKYISVTGSFVYDSGKDEYRLPAGSNASIVAANDTTITLDWGQATSGMISILNDKGGVVITTGVDNVQVTGCIEDQQGHPIATASQADSLTMVIDQAQYVVTANFVDADDSKKSTR